MHWIFVMRVETIQRFKLFIFNLFIFDFDLYVVSLRLD